MSRYTIRAYEPDGAFAFGATLNCAQELSARRLFASLPIRGRAAELICRGRIIANRAPEEALATGRLDQPILRTQNLLPSRSRKQAP